MALTTANTYTGATTIQNGTLALSGSGSVASTLIDVQAAGILDVSAIAFSLGGTQTLKANGLVNGAITTTTGSTVMGSGTIDGNLTIGGNFTPGNSPGTLTLVNDALTLGSASSSVFELGGTATAAYDRVVGISALTLDGTLTVQYFGGFNPAAGNSFDLFDFSSVDTSGFSLGTDLVLPALDPGLTWDTSAFFSAGTLSVVPEPSASVLLAGLSLLALRRRRS
jgi:autotransporter-associated beta strand protein